MRKAELWPRSFGFCFGGSRNHEIVHSGCIEIWWRCKSMYEGNPGRGQYIQKEKHSLRVLTLWCTLRECYVIPWEKHSKGGKGQLYLHSLWWEIGSHGRLLSRWITSSELYYRKINLSAVWQRFGAGSDWNEGRDQSAGSVDKQSGQKVRGPARTCWQWK